MHSTMDDWRDGSGPGLRFTSAAAEMQRESSTVLFAGYQAAGTRGRLLKDGARFTKIHGVEVQVAARIETVDSMSAHADTNEIMRWLGHFTTPPTTTFLVHGEVEPMDALKARIQKELGWSVKTPGHLERVQIT